MAGFPVPYACVRYSILHKILLSGAALADLALTELIIRQCKLIIRQCKFIVVFPCCGSVSYSSQIQYKCTDKLPSITDQINVVMIH